MSSRARAALALIGASSRSASHPVLEPLLQIVRSSHPRADVAIIVRAYDVAARAHEGQIRKSGDPYITHPLAVTTILAELGMTPMTLAAALLHDVVEDTDFTLAQMEREFGAEVAMLVDGVTKLDKVTYGSAAQAETVRKMIVAMSKDIRVLVIKLADRLHNARTWKYVSQESAQRKAKETLEIYAPLAHRLGMNTIKWELEDLSFQTLYPKVFDEIVRLVAERAPAREQVHAAVREQVAGDLRAAKIKAVVTSRPKHYYSVYQKMVVGGRDFDQIYDLVAVRVLVDTVKDCYAALGAMHARWKPLTGRFKDYIATPKFNMYQSLHTTVIGPGGRPVEIASCWTGSRRPATRASSWSPCASRSPPPRSMSSPRRGSWWACPPARHQWTSRMRSTQRWVITASAPRSMVVWSRSRAPWTMATSWRC